MRAAAATFRRAPQLGLAADERDFHLPTRDAFVAENANAMIIERLPFPIRIAASKQVEFISARGARPHRAQDALFSDFSAISSSPKPLIGKRPRHFRLPICSPKIFPIRAIHSSQAARFLSRKGQGEEAARICYVGHRECFRAIRAAVFQASFSVA